MTPTARFILLLSLVASAACAPLTPPIWYVPMSPAVPTAECDQRVNRVLEQLGYEIERFDPGTLTYVTRWRQARGLIGETRFRAVVTLHDEPPAGAEVAVIEQIYEGRGWLDNGENTSRRKELVATLASRLQGPVAR